LTEAPLCWFKSPAKKIEVPFDKLLIIRF